MKQIVTIEIEYDPATEDRPSDWSWRHGVEIDGDRVRLVASEAAEG